jgi:putative SOS response-associated peptidase YedK
MNKYDLHAEREWQRQMAERDQFYAWDNPPKKTKGPWLTDDRRAVLVLAALVGLSLLLAGVIVWLNL